MNYMRGAYEVSIRRACKVVKLHRSMYYYTATPKLDRDEEIKKILESWAEEFPHYGFWMLYYRMRLMGYEWNHKPVYRVYTALKLNLRKKPKRKLPKREKQPLEVPKSLNHTWSMDFVSDALSNGYKFRVLNLMDDFSREALTATADTSISSKRVVRILNQILEYRDKPKKLRVDNGPEFIAKALQDWADRNGVELIFIQPGKPTQNGFVERLNGTIRREVLDRFWFEDLEDARQKLDEWIIEYNRYRPHKGIGYLSPDLFVQINTKSKLKNAA